MLRVSNFKSQISSLAVPCWSTLTFCRLQPLSMSLSNLLAGFVCLDIPWSLLPDQDSSLATLCLNLVLWPGLMSTLNHFSSHGASLPPCHWPNSVILASSDMVALRASPLDESHFSDRKTSSISPRWICDLHICHCLNFP